jgi:hypothetical protein
MARRHPHPDDEKQQKARALPPCTPRCCPTITHQAGQAGQGDQAGLLNVWMGSEWAWRR